MNAPAEYSVPPISVTPASVTPVTRLANHVSQHPASAVFLAAGLGFATVLALRALYPPRPPQNRAVRILEELLHRLKEVAQPAYDRAVSLAEDGAHAVGKGVDGLGNLHLDRKFNKVWRGVTSLFH